MLTENESLHIKTYTQQMRILHKSVISSLIAAFISAIIYTLVLFEAVEVKRLLIWFLIALILPIARFMLFISKWAELTQENIRGFKQFIFIGNLASGLLWGTSAIVFFPELLEYQLFMLFMLGGLSLGATNAYANYLPGYYAYIFSALSPIVISLCLTGEKVQIGIGVTTILYTIIISGYGRLSCKNNYEGIKLRFENDELILKLEEKTLIAEQANASKSKFLATASHDLRQPLHASCLFLDALKFTLDTEPQKEILTKIVNSQAHLSKLFDTLLDISKLDSGSVEVNIQTVSIVELFASFEDKYNIIAKNKGLIFTATPIDCYIDTDPILIHRIIENFLSNAIRYTTSGAITLSAEKTTNNDIKITVVDTGIGISPHDQRRIFNEFEQLNNAEKDYHFGLGLGLSIVKRLSDLLGHEIRLESEVQQGSTFSLRCKEAHQIHTPIPTKASQGTELKRKLRILFVDDEKPIREAVELILHCFGMQVVTADSVANSINFLTQEKHALDIIITDYHLKNGETGIDVIDQVRALKKNNIPGIIITGETDPQKIKPIQKKGFAILQKPVSSDALIPLILQSIHTEEKEHYAI